MGYSTNGSGFVIIIKNTIATSGDDKGKTTGYGTAYTHLTVGECKPGYESKAADNTTDSKLTATTGSGVTLTAAKKTTTVSLSGSSSGSTSTGVVDTYEYVLYDTDPDTLQIIRDAIDNEDVVTVLSGYGYDVSNNDLGFEALQCKLTKVVRGTTPETINTLTITAKGVEVASASTCTHATLNTKIAGLGTSGVITPTGEADVSLVDPSSREFDADAYTSLKKGKIVPRN